MSPRAALEMASPRATTRRVAEAVRATLTALQAKRLASVAGAGRAELGAEEPEQAYPPEQLLRELDAGAATFVRGHKGQTCLQACSTLKCVCESARSVPVSVSVSILILWLPDL